MRQSKQVIIVICLSSISLSTSLAASTICRNSLYIAATISFIEIILKKIKLKFNSGTIIIYSCFLLSLSFYIPTLLYPSIALHNIDIYYSESAKRIFLGAIIAYYILAYREKISCTGWFISYFWIILGYIYTIFLALKYYKPEQRLEINTVSTMTAYVFVLLSLVTIFIALKSNKLIRLVLITILSSSSMYVILLTQTRSVILTYPFLLLYLLLKEHFFKNKTYFIITLIIYLIIALCFPIVSNIVNNATKRISHSFIEFYNYKNYNNSTSIGSRFSIWKAGLFSFKRNIFGQSADIRNNLATLYIKECEKSNPEALRVIKYHYHNDILESLTLRGIIGCFILIAFFIIVILSSILFTGNVNVTLLVMLPTIIYGSTDSVFIDSRYITIMILLIPFYLCSTQNYISTNNT